MSQIAWYIIGTSLWVGVLITVGRWEKRTSTPFIPKAIIVFTVMLVATALSVIAFLMPFLVRVLQTRSP